MEVTELKWDTLLNANRFQTILYSLLPLFVLTLELHCEWSETWMVFWFPRSCAWKKLFLFLSRQCFISESAVAEAWYFVLAGTCSWSKKSIICKPFQGSFRCQSGTWEKVYDTHRAGTVNPWRTPLRVRTCMLFQEQGKIWPKTLSSLPVPAATDSATWKLTNLELGMEPEAMDQASWNHNHSLQENWKWPLGWGEEGRGGGGH